MIIYFFLDPKSWNYPWKLWTYIPGWNRDLKFFEMQTYYEIGEAAAKKDPRLLYDQLQEGYRDKLTQIYLSLRRIRLKELKETIASLYVEIQSALFNARPISQAKIDNMQAMQEEVDEINTELAERQSSLKKGA